MCHIVMRNIPQFNLLKCIYSIPALLEGICRHMQVIPAMFILDSGWYGFAECPDLTWLVYCNILQIAQNLGGVLGSHVWRQSNLHQCQQTNATVCKCVSPRCRSTVIQGSKSGKHWNIMRHLQRYTKMHHWSTRVSVSKVHARHHSPRDEASHTQKLARICSQPGSHSCPNEVMPGDLLPCRFGNVDGIPNWLGLHPEHLHLHGAKEFGQYGVCGC